MNKHILSFTLALILSTFSIAQNVSTTPEFQSRYHMLDSAELFVPRVAGKSFTPTAPPQGVVRAIAEWEPQQSVIIAYKNGFGIPYSLIAEMSQDINVITIVASLSQQNTVISSYTSNGVNLSNCTFVIAPIDSYWSRDYSPWFIMVNNSEIAIIDFPYNRPSRPNDDNVPVVMASHLNTGLYGMNVLHTGGNFMCDGMGAAAMTDLVEDENTSLTTAQIDTLFKKYMGITRNYITTDPLGDYIKHIDCWGKFLDVDKILITSVPVSNSQYNAYEAMATFWANQTSSYGNNYKVYRTYSPNGQPYTNSLILNNKVFVPTKSNYPTQNADALAVYAQAMPGYQIFSINSTSWQSTDALHCRTHEVADKHMLYVQHMPYWGGQPIQSQYVVDAHVYALSGSAVIADSVYLKYKINAGAWQHVNMNLVSGNKWRGYIPQQMPGDTVKYYIHASDLSPRNVNHPFIGQYSPHLFYITNVVSTNEKNIIETLVFPNPANDFIFVNIKDCSVPNVQIKLINAVGAEVISFNEMNPCEKLVKINTADLPVGSYFLKIISDNNAMVKKIMIMH